jgi:amidophosphoribosyltransferase
MCGIVGLFLKNRALEAQLGSLFKPMLVDMTERGPDSTGIAVYRDFAPDDAIKISLYCPDEEFDWHQVAMDITANLDLPAHVDVMADHALLITPAKIEAVRKVLKREHPNVIVNSYGRRIELYKGVGLPEQVADRFHVSAMTGTHALGHTRMATESAVTTQHSHPFATGLDLCLVHNGSLSNYNRLRDWLSRHGIVFQTDNDTEVAAGYFAHKMSQGMSLRDALLAGLEDLDGFFTFAVATRDGFAVIRDHIACKPAVMAESDDWVAMASEYRAIAELPGAESARVWEPAAAEVYSWERAA